MSSEMMLIRIQTIREDLLKVLAANAANAAYIDKYMHKIKDRLDVLEDDAEKIEES